MFSVAGSLHENRSSGTGFSGYFLFLASFQAKKLLRAHLVFLSVLTGTTPLDRIASSSSSTKVEKRSRVELVFEPVVWVWDLDAELLLSYDYTGKVFLMTF